MPPKAKPWNEVQLSLKFGWLNAGPIGTELTYLSLVK